MKGMSERERGGEIDYRNWNGKIDRYIEREWERENKFCINSTPN